MELSRELMNDEVLEMSTKRHLDRTRKAARKRPDIVAEHAQSERPKRDGRLQSSAEDVVDEYVDRQDDGPRPEA